MVCITQHLQPLPYDPAKDFVAVARTTTSWMGMGINPQVPANNLQEFIAYAKANPGKINFGSAGLATITQLYGEMLQHRGRREDGARALQGQRAGDQRPAVRPDPGAVRPDHPAAHRGRPAEMLRRAGREALARQARRADPEGAGPGQDRRRRLVRHPGRKGTPQPVIDKLSKAIGEAVKDPRRQREAGKRPALRQLPGAGRLSREDRPGAQDLRRGDPEGQHQGVTARRVEPPPVLAISVP